MKVKELIHHKLETMEPTATAKDIAIKMRDLNIGAIPIVHANQVLGIVTDRDLTINVLAKRENPEKINAKDFMTKNVQTCFDDDEVEKCAEIMAQKQIRRCLVLDHMSKKPVGVISLRDLALGTGTKNLAGDILLKVEKAQRATQLASR